MNIAIWWLKCFTILNHPFSRIFLMRLCLFLYQFQMKRNHPHLQVLLRNLRSMEVMKNHKWSWTISSWRWKSELYTKKMSFKWSGNESELYTKKMSFKWSGNERKYPAWNCIGHGVTAVTRGLLHITQLSESSDIDRAETVHACVKTRNFEPL